MIAELEQYLEGLKADLEVEVDLFGSRTPIAYDLRSLIRQTEEELKGLKS